jgi:hypothetical protein
MEDALEPEQDPSTAASTLRDTKPKTIPAPPAVLPPSFPNRVTRSSPTRSTETKSEEARSPSSITKRDETLELPDPLDGLSEPSEGGLTPDGGLTPPPGGGGGGGFGFTFGEAPPEPAGGGFAFGLDASQSKAPEPELPTTPPKPLELPAAEKAAPPKPVELPAAAAPPKAAEPPAVANAPPKAEKPAPATKPTPRIDDWDASSSDHTSDSEYDLPRPLSTPLGHKSP